MFSTPVPALEVCPGRRWSGPGSPRGRPALVLPRSPWTTRAGGTSDGGTPRGTDSHGVDRRSRVGADVEGDAQVLAGVEGFVILLEVDHVAGGVEGFDVEAQ